MDVFIADVVATADHVRARLNKTKRINISFDEWNVWYVSGVQGHDAPWQATPRISEETYTLADAVVVGSMLITLLGHSDRVTAACLAQLVNTIAPIRTEPAGAAWRQSTFYPFALTARHARGEVLRFRTEGTDLSHLALRRRAGHRRNRHARLRERRGHRAGGQPSPGPAGTARGGHAALGKITVQEAYALSGPDPSAVNTEDDPHRVVPTPIQAVAEQATLGVELPPVAWACIRLAPER